MARQKAFTLIELLVVIAIIAILAAILFPVFAQAKDSAKNTQTLSNMKQTSLAALMYGADYDDLLPLCEGSDATTYGMWQDYVQPYMKNYDMLLHVKRTFTPGPTAAHTAWKRTQYTGCFPRAAMNGQATIRANGYYTWVHSVITANNTVRFDGLFGHGGPSNMWYGQYPTSSLSQSGIGNVADTAMFSEAANWDNWWSFNDGTNSYAFRYGVQWQPADWSSYGSSWGFAGPLSLTRPKNGLTGISSPGASRPDGFTTVGFADGHAKAVDNRGELLKNVLLSDGVTRVLKYFWPAGV